MKMFYDNQYKFLHKQASFAESILIYYDEKSNNLTSNHMMYLIRSFHKIRQMIYRGPHWNITVLFNNIINLIQSDTYQKMMFKWVTEEENPIKSYDDYKIPEEYKETISEYDFTVIQFPLLKIWYFNKQDKQITVMEVHKVYIEVMNDDWTQSGKYLITENLNHFLAHHVWIVNDEEIEKAVKQIISCNNLTESFLAIKINQKLHNSLKSK